MTSPTSSLGLSSASEERSIQIAIDRYAVVAVMTLLWARIVLPALAQSYTAPKSRLSTTDTPVFSSIASHLDTLLRLSLIGLLIVILLRAIPRLPVDRIGLLAIMVAPWFWQVGRDMYADLPLKINSLTYPLLMMAIWALRPRWRQLRVLGYLMFLTAVISLLMGAFTPAQGVLRHAAGEIVSPDKEILPIGILIGPLTNGNPLGQFISFGIPLIMLIPRRTLRWAGVGFSLAAVIWTSNRSSLVSIGISGVLAGVLMLLRPAGRRAVTTIILTAGCLMVAYFPLTVRTDEAFTNRGLIWRASLTHFQEHEWIGLNSKFYSQVALYANNIAPTAFHGHNQLVQTLVLGGLINLLFVVLMLGVLIRAVANRAAKFDQIAPAALIAMVLVSSCFEVAFYVLTPSVLTIVVITPMAFMVFAGDEPPASDVQESDESEETSPLTVPMQRYDMAGPTTGLSRAAEQDAMKDLWGSGVWPPEFSPDRSVEDGIGRS